MNKDFIRRTWRMHLTSFAPIIAACIGKEVALGIESSTRNRSLNGRECF